jgi:molybdate transport system substrate-binding protein
MRSTLSLLVALTTFVAAGSAGAGEARVAVAANFAEAVRAIGERFTAATGHRALFSFGSTGTLYAQIGQGAPFEVYLAADRARPERAVVEGLAVPGSRFTYASGRLVLYSRDPDRVRGADTLRQGDFTRLAIANPVTAPYGAAAVAAMEALGVYRDLAPRLVQGNNVAQAYQFVATGNAEVGLVALSQVAGHGRGSRWPVPAELHPPIAQDAVLLRRGAENPAARAFLDFLRGPEAEAVKRTFGYGD